MATRKENTFHEVRFITHGSQAGIGVLVIVRLRFHHQFRVRFFISFSACVSKTSRLRIVMDIRTYETSMNDLLVRREIQSCSMKTRVMLRASTNQNFPLRLLTEQQAEAGVSATVLIGSAKTLSPKSTEIQKNTSSVKFDWSMIEFLATRVVSGAAI